MFSFLRKYKRSSYRISIISPTQCSMIQKKIIYLYVFIERKSKDNDITNGTKCETLVNPSKGYKGVSCTILATFPEV